MPVTSPNAVTSPLVREKKKKDRNSAAPKEGAVCRGEREGAEETKAQEEKCTLSKRYRKVERKRANNEEMVFQETNNRTYRRRPLYRPFSLPCPRFRCMGWVGRMLGGV